MTAKQDDGKPLFGFLQMGDTHVYAGPADAMHPSALAKERVQWVVRTVSGGTLSPVPDFVIHSGDMIDGEPQSAGVPALGPDLRLFKTLIEPLGCPFYPCVGNHENQQQEGDMAREGPYREVFGADRVNYTFRHGGIQFVVFNDSGAPNVKHDVRKARNQWVRQTLEGEPQQPRILCCHIPLVPLREEQVLSRSFGYPSYTAGDPELLEVVEAHADTVIAVLSGHLHLTGAVLRNGIYHVVPSGAATWPCDYGALYTVFTDRIQVEMQSVPRELALPDERAIGIRGSIHGKPRHAEDFVDREHPTPELYQCGREDERTFEILLNGKKRVAAG